MRMLSQVLSDGYEVVVDDRFEGPDLDPTIWFPYYLPQWSSRERSVARYHLADGRLHLRIDEDQAPWAPELDGPLRVSSLQTGVFAGPLGSRIGQHGVHPGAVVTEEQPDLRLLTPTYGAFALTASWQPHPDRMVALWMIGFEERPEQSAEICVCEIFGTEAAPGDTLVGMGVHPFDDPSIVDDFEKVRLPIDVREPHEYAAVWTPDDVTFYVDDRPVEHVAQSPSSPMQFMLNIYDFGRATAPWTGDAFEVDRFRCWRQAASRFER